MNLLEGKLTLKLFGFNETLSELKNGEKPKCFNVDF